MQFYDGSTTQRVALKIEVLKLHAKGVSDQSIVDAVMIAKVADRIPKFPKTSLARISRPTLQRYRTQMDGELSGARFGPTGLLFNFLACCPDIPNGLFQDSVQISSAHTLAPLLRPFVEHFGARRGQLDFSDIESLKGTYHVYRKAWTSKKYDTYIRTIMTFESVGEALFYTEMQSYNDTAAATDVDERDMGFVLPFGMNVVTLARGQDHEVIKFTSIHDFYPYPDGRRPVTSFAGNSIAVYGKGPHPGYRIIGQRVAPEDASSRFYAEGELEASLREKLNVPDPI